MLMLNEISSAALNTNNALISVISGVFCLLGAGERIPPSTLHNFASIKAMTMRLGGEVVRPKMSPLTSATRSDEVK